jgi:hypothetical protein
VPALKNQKNNAWTQLDEMDVFDYRIHWLFSGLFEENLNG